MDDRFEEIQMVLRRRSKNCVILTDCSIQIFNAYEERLRSGIAAHRYHPEILKLSVISESDLSLKGRSNDEVLEEFFKDAPTQFPNTVLWLKNLHLYLGDPTSVYEDLSCSLSPVLTRGQLQIVTSVPLGKYHSIIAQDSAIDRRFHTIHPSI